MAATDCSCPRKKSCGGGGGGGGDQLTTNSMILWEPEKRKRAAHSHYSSDYQLSQRFKELENSLIEVVGGRTMFERGKSKAVAFNRLVHTGCSLPPPSIWDLPEVQQMTPACELNNGQDLITLLLLLHSSRLHFSLQDIRKERIVQKPGRWRIK
jgi:hypothetical protein